MKTYIVGGAVRDRLLGLPVHDRDWVVVGATPQDMLAQGFKPVGKDFPVFLHPDTHEEYALARTERKTAPGYRGFVVHAEPSVTLEQDLSRRDLTINAMAEDDNGQLIDPHHGQADLRAGILRHVSPAFGEDPVRILRLARFAARYGFSVAPETMALMRDMTARGEVDALVAERVWQELAKGLMEQRPSIMFDILRACDALPRLLPEVNALFGIPQRAAHHPEIDAGRHVMLALDTAAAAGATLDERFAVLCHDLGKALTPAELLPAHRGHDQSGLAPLDSLCTRLKPPSECRELAAICIRYHVQLRKLAQQSDAEILNLLKGCDALRRPERFARFLRVCQFDIQGRSGEAIDFPQAGWAQVLLDAVNAINAGAIAGTATDKQAIPQLVETARLSAIRATRQQIGLATIAGD